MRHEKFLVGALLDPAVLWTVRIHIDETRECDGQTGGLREERTEQKKG